MSSDIAPVAKKPWQTFVMFFLLFIFSSLPILAVKVPMLLDYPNHLARIYIIAHQNDEPFSHFFSVSWRAVPDLAMDIVTPLVARLIGIFLAGKLFILVTIFLITSGTLALHYAVYRDGKGPALCFLFIFNSIFMYGFLNYLFAAGLALWATAGWAALRNRSRLLRSIFSTCAISVLFLSHFGGVALYALAICCYEISRCRWQDRYLKLKQISLDGIVTIAPFSIAIALMSASPTAHGWANTDWPMLQQKWIGPYLIFKSEDLLLDALFTLFIFVGLGCCIYFKRLKIPPLAWVFLLFGGATYLIVPGKVLNVDQVDTRLPAAFVFFLIGMVRWRLDTSMEWGLFNGIIAVVLAVRVLGVVDAWEVYSEIVSDYEQSFSKIGIGSRVLVTQDSAAGWRGSGNRVTKNMDRGTIIHLPTLATIERSCLVSTIFADPGKQIVTVKAPYSDAIPVDASLQVTNLDLQSDRGSMGNGYAQDWRDRYDYLYVQYAPPGSHLHLADLTLIYQGRSFQLYRIAGSR